ncbi:MAG: TIM barrel protein [Planctomycetes bacterium]|nr:TIM barrel protein [Planctomycetota bacterium]
MHPSDHGLDRRTLLAAAAGASLSRFGLGQDPQPTPTTPAKKRLRQSVCRWIYGNIPLEEFCAKVAAIGITGIDLLTANEWQVPKRHGLTCSMAYGPKSMQIHHGLNRLEHHDEFVAEAEKLLPRIAAAGIPNMIVFSGNRGGQDDATGIGHCVTGLKRLAPLAEQAGVTLCLEYLNSKVDHKDYAFDRMAYGLEICKQVGSPRVKLLYDIYHAQIMEGDVIRTIQQHHQWIGHYHTGGVPGRRDIDETQELYYPAICRAILATGYEGFVAHEYLPKSDPLGTLAKAFALCDV